MAIKDVFNNSNDNYLKTGLAPCTGSDTNIFQFFPKKDVGVSNGSQILQIMNLGDIQIEVSSWNQNKKILGPGEVTFIPGLTKELDNRSQTFASSRYIPDTSLLYMGAEYTITHNQNFRQITTHKHSYSDPSTNKTLVNAMNMDIAALGIDVTVSIDSSTVTFTGNTPGYNFDVEDPIVLVDFDASMNQVGLSWSVGQDINKATQYAKYTNGAMLGIILKATYPIDQITYDKWLYISHVNNTFNWLDPTYYGHLIDTGSLIVSTATVMRAGDYLNYITVNNLWDKIGYFYSKINTFDQDNNATKNLVPGFYVFNPHSFSVEIDYMMIN